MERRQFLKATGATAAVGATAGCMGFGYPRSESEYTGFILDTEVESGIIFKNTHIHVKTSPRSSQSEDFYLRMPQDSEMLEKAQRALQEQRRVTITYERGLFENPTDAFDDHSVATHIELHDETLDDE